MKRVLAFLAAAGMAVAPMAASAQDASPLSLAGASAPAASGLSFLQEEGGEGGGGTTAVALGVLLVVLIGVAAISGNNDRPTSP